MYFKVFLDTNIYEGSGFSFENRAFNQLRFYANDGSLNLQINSVVEGEVKQHIKDCLTDAVAEIKRPIKKNKNFAGFRGNTKFLPQIPEPDEWIEYSIERFETLLSDLGAERIPVDNISVENLLSDFFNKRLPFEAKKPTEFRDAIMLRSVFAEIERLSEKNRKNGSKDHDNLIFKYKFESPWHNRSEGTIDVNRYVHSDELIYCIVSADKGVMAAAKEVAQQRPAEDIQVFDGLNSLLAYISKQQKLAFVLGELLDSGFGAVKIEEAARIAVEAADIDIEGYDGYIEDVTVEEVETDDVSTFVLSAQELSDGTRIATVAVSTSVAVKLQFSHMNEDMSPWDRETKHYLWKSIDVNVAEYTTSFDMVFDIDITDLEMDIETDTLTEEGMELVNDWASKGEWVVLDTKEMPDSIYFYEGDCVYNETVDTREEEDW